MSAHIREGFDRGLEPARVAWDLKTLNLHLRESLEEDLGLLHAARDM